MESMEGEPMTGASDAGQPDTRWARRAQRELRDLLNTWDPIGVYPSLGGSDDEYDCIRDTLLSHLTRGDSRVEIGDYLRTELERHFGLSRPHVPGTVIDEIFSWWEQARP
jgi:hypothetical protein